MHRASIVNLDMDQNRPAADGAVFHVFLAMAGGRVDWYDDFFTAGVADIADFVLHWANSTLKHRLTIVRGNLTNAVVLCQD